MHNVNGCLWHQVCPWMCTPDVSLVDVDVSGTRCVPGCAHRCAPGGCRCPGVSPMCTQLKASLCVVCTVCLPVVCCVLCCVYPPDLLHGSC